MGSAILTSRCSLALAGKRDKERAITSIAVYSSGTMSEDSAIEVLIKSFDNLIPQAPILMLEPCLPLELEVIPRVEDYLVEQRGFGSSSPVVLKPRLCLFPRVAPEHTGEFGELGVKLSV